MGYLKDIVEYGRNTEQDRQRLVGSYRQTEAAYLLVLALVLAGLVVGLAWLGNRDAQGCSKQERAQGMGQQFAMEREVRIK